MTTALSSSCAETVILASCVTRAPASKLPDHGIRLSLSSMGTDHMVSVAIPWGRFVKSALDNLPGPTFKGNLKQFANRHATEFQHKVAQNYGPVVKMHGLLGVCADPMTRMNLNSV
ncbi:hypothetical protein AcV7_006392 [Taiwanofungus camphoratus]|nr:hypothetical protein AcV7_006392 [Antrodia cinnamomea]